MTREALIQGKNQIAILENGVLVNYYQHSDSCSYGDIYWGRVVKCASGNSDACFVDIGLSENAFCPDKDKMKQDDFGPFMVETSAHDNKAVRVSNKIKITGKYMVSLSQKGVINISSKIIDTESRNRIRSLGEAVLDKFTHLEGLLFRTEASEANEEVLVAAARELNSLLGTINQGKPSPGLMYRPDFVISTLSKYNKYDNIVTDDVEIYEKIKGLYPEVRFRQAKEYDLFDVKDISSKLVSLTGKRVWLPSGGNIVIETTEAMTVIDVNSGKATGNKASKDAVNKEAITEIMRQLRLRNIGGIIICDLISSHKEAEEEILKLSKELSQNDPGKPVIHGFTHLGLLEISRKRT
ncbi:MAG: hypothetical protein E7388_00205 [Ruminococcaceae bacterium]|nr:hypothetical protein [Oscillospiraceae bacterium]